MKSMRKILAVLSLVLLSCGAAWGDLVYTTSDYTTGTLGTIEIAASGATVSKALFAGLGGDTLIWSYGQGEAARVIVDERAYGTGSDRVYVFEPNSEDGWSEPKNEVWSIATNTHGIVRSVDGNSLYATCNDSANVVEINATTYKTTGRFYAFPKGGLLGGYEPFGEKAVIVGDTLYALFSMRSGSYPNFSYLESKVRGLKVDGAALVETGASFDVGRNAVDMVEVSQGKLAVGFWGGNQAFGARGGIDVIDTTAGTVERAVSLAEGGVTALCSDGKGGLWYIAQVYSDDPNATPTSSLYHWTGSSDGTLVRDISSTTGYSFQVAWDAVENVLYVLAGDKILILDSAGTLRQTFDSAALGGPAYSIAVADIRPAGQGGGEESSGGGGCGTMGFGVLTLALPLCLIRRKGR
ncbi:MAG: hypothetical protein IJR14_00530 [Synergistaceae bacterium]|nr:hypothetical protein [Synergistaceae bacterium]